MCDLEQNRCDLYVEAVRATTFTIWFEGGPTFSLVLCICAYYNYRIIQVHKDLKGANVECLPPPPPLNAAMPVARQDSLTASSKVRALANSSGVKEKRGEAGWTSPGSSPSERNTAHAAI